MHVVQATENFSLATTHAHQLHRIAACPNHSLVEIYTCSLFATGCCCALWLHLRSFCRCCSRVAFLFPNPHTLCKWISTTFCTLLNVHPLLFISFFICASIALFSSLPPLYYCNDLKLVLAALNIRNVAHPRFRVTLGCLWTFGSLCAGLSAG